jgi:hypothetical protein
MPRVPAVLLLVIFKMDPIVKSGPTKFKAIASSYRARSWNKR